MGLLIVHPILLVEMVDQVAVEEELGPEVQEIHHQPHHHKAITAEPVAGRVPQVMHQEAVAERQLSVLLETITAVQEAQEQLQHYRALLLLTLAVAVAVSTQAIRLDRAAQVAAGLGVHIPELVSLEPRIQAEVVVALLVAHKLAATAVPVS